MTLPQQIALHQTTMNTIMANQTTMLKNIHTNNIEIKVILQHLTEQVAELHRKLDIRQLPPPIPLSATVAVHRKRDLQKLDTQTPSASHNQTRPSPMSSTSPITSVHSDVAAAPEMINAGFMKHETVSVIKSEELKQGTSSGASVPSSAFHGSSLKKSNLNASHGRTSIGSFKVMATGRCAGLGTDISDDQQDITREKGLVDSLFQAPTGDGTNIAVLSSYEYISQGLREYQMDNTLDGLYIAPAAAFMDKFAVHMAKNFMNLPNIKVPLILGLWGGNGPGNFFQCELVMSAGELESGNAGESAKLDAHSVFVEMNKPPRERKILIFDPGGLSELKEFSTLRTRSILKGWVMIRVALLRHNQAPIMQHNHICTAGLNVPLSHYRE